VLMVGGVVAMWKVKSARSNLRFTAERAQARAPFYATSRSARTNARSTLRHKAERACRHASRASSFCRSFLCNRLHSVAFPCLPIPGIPVHSLVLHFIASTCIPLDSCDHQTITMPSQF
jgi:hypothetical protein